jgi:flagellar hook-associated protein 3 FlgL
VQASVGARLKELDNLDSTGDDLNTQYTQTLSDLQDLDMVKAISLFTQQQQTLQAAQVSFKTMSGLSLFNYIT